jgi:hypothetical protein
MEFVGFKTAVVVDTKGLLTDLICDEEIFSVLTEKDLPKGWGLNATGVSGAAGFYLEFAIDHLPTHFELTQVLHKLKGLDR